MFNKQQNRRVALIGTGFVGMSFAYALVNQGSIDELVLIDLNHEKAMSEAMDLNHGSSFAPGNTKVYAGTYDDCKYVDIVVITAGAAQKEGETRLDLTEKNTIIIKDITERIMRNGFDGLILVASNPVDIMTYVVQKVSGLSTHQVFGSGTTLDSSRLQYLLGNYLSVSNKDINAFVIGEHGDSSFIPWSNAYVATKSLKEYLLKRSKGNSDILENIYIEVRDSAYQIIQGKNATYYAIGMALARIVNTIFSDESAILPVSVMLEGQYEQYGIYIGVPAIVNRMGIESIVELELTVEERAKLDYSIKHIKEEINCSVTKHLK